MAREYVYATASDGVEIGMWSTDMTRKLPWGSDASLLPVAAVLFVIGVLAAGWTCGCSSDTRSHIETLAYLQKGNFRGHITVHTDGQVGGEAYSGVRGGASHSNLTADGTVDYSIPPGSGVAAGDMPEPTTQPVEE